MMVAASACGEPRDRVATAPRDSAGVRLVESRLGNPAQTWRLSAEPLGEMAGGGGVPFQVVSAFRAADGRIVVASAGTGELRIYGADGGHQRTIGRKGGGPGEFARLFWAGRWRGDSIAAWDAQLARLSVFDASGMFARALTPRAQLGIFPQVHAVLSDGSVVLAAGMDPARAGAMSSGVRRDSVTFVVMGPDGALRDTLGYFPGTEQYLMIPPNGGFVMHPLPFGRATATAAQGDRFAVATGDAYELALYEPGHGLREVLRAPRERPRVTEADVRRYRETMVTMGADAFARRQREQFLRDVPYPERMPALAAVLPDGRGNWWIQDPPTAAEPVWNLVGGNGRHLGRLRTPDRLIVKEIGPDWLLGVYLDENDVEHVRLYALQR